MSDVDRLRDAWMATGAPASGCADPETLWAAARGELRGDALRSLLDHVAACPSCAPGWSLARQMQERAGLAAGAEPAWRRWTAVAALLIAGALVIPLLLREPAPPAYRDEGGEMVKSLLPDGEPLPRGACVLRWSEGPPGSRYGVEVATEARGVLLARRNLDEAMLRVPPELLEDLPAGETLLWRVTMVLPDGSVVSSLTFLTPLE